VQCLRFHVAPTTCSDRLRERIEAALAGHLRQQKGLVGEFQETDVRYIPLQTDDAPVTVHISWQRMPRGVPEVLEA
jgi:hypothetical protein